jgi:hypothetical protein
MGALVCGGLLLLGLILRAPLIVSLFASLVFGATAIVNLTSLGGSSPLIYTFFGAALLLAVAARRTFFTDLGLVFARFPSAFVICALVAYTCIGAIILPRFFAGETSALVTVRGPGGAGKVSETLLAPTGGNLTQSAYFVLSALMFFAIAIILLQRDNVRKVRAGFIAWASAQACLGMIDWTAKMAGAGDVLAPIRTANYAMLTEVEHGGFARISGGFSEASAFGGVTLACLAFTFADWKVSGSRWMLVLSVMLMFLLVMSTSSTAYVALAVVMVVVSLTIMQSLLAGRVGRSDLVLLASAFLGLLLVMFLYLADSQAFEPFIKLFDVTILNKSSSESAVERSHWNAVSLQSALDTYLLGIGVGSSRASSWIIAVVSQLGLFGSVLTLALALHFCRRIPPARRDCDIELVALHQGARAAALCGIVTGSIASGTADPGVMFFMALATVLACRHHVYADSSLGRFVGRRMQHPGQLRLSAR